MKVRLLLPPFGVHEIDVQSCAGVDLHIALASDSLYGLHFGLTHKAADGVYEAHLTRIAELMPPITPQCYNSLVNPDGRLPHPDGPSAEAAQRRTEWRALELDQVLLHGAAASAAAWRGFMTSNLN